MSFSHPRSWTARISVRIHCQQYNLLSAATIPTQLMQSRKPYRLAAGRFSVQRPNSLRQQRPRRDIRHILDNNSPPSVQMRLRRIATSHNYQGR
ncbi:hypothetical protein IG631_21507 [Alternaria alternata]|nr:hypothetical protein IG631_21507 [Alternaria alternata]